MWHGETLSAQSASPRKISLKASGLIEKNYSGFHAFYLKQLKITQHDFLDWLFEENLVLNNKVEWLISRT